MQAQKERQFLEILDDNHTRIQKLCTMYATSEEDQKDLVQEVIINIWKSFSSFKGDAAISTWIYRVILNICLKKRYAQPQKQQIISLENLDFEPIQTTEESFKDFTALRECIQQLSFSDKSIIILFLEELQYKEIGEIVGISENYVAVKIKRIKAKLAICLGK